MCACGKPTINGQPNAYSWDGKMFMTRAINWPETAPDDEILFEEPGRCGGIDAHCTDIRLVRRYGGLLILSGNHDKPVQVQYGNRQSLVSLLSSLDSDGRYWLLHSLQWTAQVAARDAENRADYRWAHAIVNKKIRRRTRKGGTSVWIDSSTNDDVSAMKSA